MTKNSKWLVLVLALVLVLGGAYFLYGRLSAQVEAEDLAPVESQPGDETAVAAPDFTVVDTEGAEVQLSDFIGAPIVLNFWASWCGPCQSEMPDFDAAWQELEGEVHFLMVNMTDGSRETVDTAQSYVEDAGFTFPVYFDTQSQAAIAYGAYSLPTTYFIDIDGNLAARAIGAIDRDTLQRGLDLILPQD